MAQELLGVHPAEVDHGGTGQRAQQIVGGTGTWLLGNAVLAENQNDALEVSLVGKTYDADIPTRGTAESTSCPMSWAVVSREAVSDAATTESSV